MEEEGGNDEDEESIDLDGTDMDELALPDDTDKGAAWIGATDFSSSTPSLTEA